jgi:pyruvate kinase
MFAVCPIVEYFQGPEIRTGMLENGKPVQLTSGQEVTITTDYTAAGNSGLIAMRCGS